MQSQPSDKIDKKIQRLERPTIRIPRWRYNELLDKEKELEGDGDFSEGQTMF
jgi:hypothetical protein